MQATLEEIARPTIEAALVYVNEGYLLKHHIQQKLETIGVRVTRKVSSNSIGNVDLRSVEIVCFTEGALSSGQRDTLLRKANFSGKMVFALNEKATHFTWQRVADYVRDRTKNAFSVPPASPSAPALPSSPSNVVPMRPPESEPVRPPLPSTPSVSTADTEIERSVAIAAYKDHPTGREITGALATDTPDISRLLRALVAVKRERDGFVARAHTAEEKLTTERARAENTETVRAQWQVKHDAIAEELERQNLAHEATQEALRRALEERDAALARAGASDAPGKSFGGQLGAARRWLNEAREKVRQLEAELEAEREALRAHRAQATRVAKPASPASPPASPRPAFEETKIRSLLVALAVDALSTEDVIAKLRALFS